jgi:prepilin-type N-terminal cleavage/methylation domain-containing protein
MNQNPSRSIRATDAVSRLIRNPGFTLIELLVSIAILTVMVLLIAKIMSDSSRASQIAYQQAFDDANARAVLDTLMDDLSQIVVVSNRYEVSRRTSRLSKYGVADEFLGDDIRFHAFLGTSNTILVAQYGVDEDPDSDGLYRLKRGEADLGKDPDAFPILDHVAQFQVRFYDGAAREVQSALHEVPQYVDVYLMLVSDATHQRVKQMQRASASAATIREYIYKNGRRHYVRAYPIVVQGRGKKPIGGRVQNLDY